MASIRQLYVALSLKAENFNNQIRAAQNEAREFQRNMRPTTQLLNDVGTAMTNAGRAATIGLTVPIAGFAAVAVRNFGEAAQATALLENAIRSTGGVAGVTARELKTMSESLQLRTLFDDDEIIRRVMTNLLTFTNVGKEVFGDATEAALNMSQVLGQDLQSSAIQLGKALNDPINGVTALQRVGVKLSESQKQLVKDMVASGDVMGAQKVILRELQTEFGGAAEAAAKAGTGPITQLKNQIGDLTEKFGEIIVKGINPFVEKISKIIDWIDSWSDSTKQLVVVLGGVAAAIGPILVVMGTLAGSISNLILLYVKLVPVITASTAATGAFGVAMTALPWVAVAAGVTSLILLLSELSETYRNNKEASEQMKSALQTQAELNSRNVAKLAEYGIHIDKTTKSIDEVTQETARWNMAMRTWDESMLKSKGSIEGVTVNLAKGLVVHKEMRIVTEAEREAMEKFRKEVDAMKTSVTGSQSTIRTLATAIRELEQAHVPTEAIARRLAGQLKEQRDLAMDMGRALDPLVEKYYELSIAIKAVKDRGQIDVVRIDDLRQQEQAMRQSINNIKIELDILRGTQIQASNEMHAEVIKDSQVTKDILTQSAREAAEQIGNTAALGGVAMTREQEKRAEQIEKVWTEAAGNITSSLSKGLADVIFSGANFGSTMVNIAKQTARGMFEAFLTGLLSPLTSALGRLGANLGGMIFGGAGGGGILGGVLGGGGGAAAGTASAGGIGGALGLGGGAGLLGLGAATIPVLGGAALGVYQLTRLFGRGHRTADEFVNQLQNPFGQLLGQIKTKEELESAWAQFNESADRFGSQGSTQDKVVRQAHRTLDPLIAKLRNDLPSAAPVTNNYFEIQQQPEQDTGQLVNDIIRYLQGSSYDADRFNQAIGAMA